MNSYVSTVVSCGPYILFPHMFLGCCRNVFSFAFISKHFSNYLICAGLSFLALSGNISQRQVRTCLAVLGTVSLIAALMSK